MIAKLMTEEGTPYLVEMRLMEGSLGLPEPALDLEFVDCGAGTRAQDFPKSVNGRIALVRRGEVSFHEKATFAQTAGAIACVVFNNRVGNFFGSLGEEEQRPAIPVVSVSMQDGERMRMEIAETGKPSMHKLRLDPQEVPQPNRLAEFSSRGPTRTGQIKPEVTAPGVNIHSATITEETFPGAGMADPSGYISASGTSMAAPHVAGFVALIRQAHPEWNSLQIKAALVNTAQFMEDQGGVTDQGNGAISLERAIDCRAVLVTAADPISPTHSFGLVVNGGELKRVSQPLTIQPLVADAAKDAFRLSVEVVGHPKGLQAELAAAGVTCEGEACMAGFDLTLTADGSLLLDGAYYGWVVAETDWGTLRLPFYYEAVKQPSVTPPDPTLGSKRAPSLPVQRVGLLPSR